MLPFALTASDGSYWKLLQLQDSPEGGRPSLSDCQQQQRKGRALHHITELTALWKHAGIDSFSYSSFSSWLSSLFRLWFLSSVCWSKTFTSWMKAVPIGCPMATSTLRWASPFSPGPVSFDHPKNHLFSVILFLRNLWSWHGRLGSSWHGNRWSVHLRRIGPSYTTSTLLPSSARTVRETFLHMSKYLFVIVCYPLHLFPTISFSQSSPGLYLASYESESPENQVEKDRWKALRSE